jgi:tRNA pseudouridine55 synthase
VRRLLNAQKAGHAGTLDPLATGVLPIALGEATKTVPHLVDARKGYRFTIAWGTSTTTRTGRRGVGHRRAPAPEQWSRAPRLLGRIEQVPPAFRRSR